MSSQPTSHIAKSPKNGTSTVVNAQDDQNGTKPDFIYGGPFIEDQKPCPFLDIATPINIELQGIFKKSFAYYSLKERMPVILTKVIDYLSREGSKIKSKHQASDEDLRLVMSRITKLKNDLMTNKRYEKLDAAAEEADKWNEWMDMLEHPKYYTNTWVWTECYIYRKMREACELTKGLRSFDPFDEQKDNQFANSLEPMCVVAERVLTMLGRGGQEAKEDFITLLKLTLWGNKCDLSLSSGESVSMGGPDHTRKAGDEDKANTGHSAKTEIKIQVFDPFQMILEYNEKLLVDDSAKVYDHLNSRSESTKRALDKNASASDVTFDIVCDNAGYELFTDLCLATFLIAQKLVKRVRFHVKKFPWFVSDVTPRDFKYVIESCKNATYNREIPLDPISATNGEVSPPRVISSEPLRQLGQLWAQHLQDGAFIMRADPYWTYPHVYKDMKKYDASMYGELQKATAVLFKGDLNYRKLLGERNCSAVVGFEHALQGFHPAPLIAVRTVKADLICGLPKGKWEELNQTDEKWMETGNYGVIQLCTKSEPKSAKPCVEPCSGVVSPPQAEL